MVDLVRCARAHCYAHMIAVFIDQLKANPYEGLGRVLKHMSDLFALSWLEKDAHVLLESGHFNSNDMDLLRESIRVKCLLIRPDAVPLVPATPQLTLLRLTPSTFRISSFKLPLDSLMVTFTTTTWRPPRRSLPMAPHPTGTPSSNRWYNSECDKFFFLNLVTFIFPQSSQSEKFVSSKPS